MTSDLPEGWRPCPLAELTKVHHGFAFKGEYFDDEPPGDLLVTPGNFAIGGGFSWAKRKYYRGPVDQQYVLREGDLLVSMTDLSKAADTLGSAAVIPRAPDGARLLHNQRLGRIEILTPERIDKLFLYVALRTHAYRQQIVATATGTTVKHTSPTRIGEAVIPLPPLEEQEQIAGVLGALDDKIDANRRLITTLGGISGMVFARAEQGVTDSAALEDYVQVIDCLHSKKPERRPDGGLLLQLNNIRQDGLIDLGSKFLISDGDYANWTRRIELKTGDCVITNVGRVGAVARIPGIRAAPGRNMTGLRCRPHWPYPTVLIEALRSVRMRREIDRLTDAGTVMSALNVRNIPRLPIAVFDRETLDRLEGTLEPIWLGREGLLAESFRLAAVRAALLPKLISGQRRVADVTDLDEAPDPAAAEVAA